MCKPCWKRNLCMSFSHRIILGFGTSFDTDDFKSGIIHRRLRPLGHGIWLLLEQGPMNFTYIPPSTFVQGKVCSQIGVSTVKNVCLEGQAGHPRGKSALWTSGPWHQWKGAQNWALPFPLHFVPSSQTKPPVLTSPSETFPWDLPTAWNSSDPVLATWQVLLGGHWSMYYGFGWKGERF